VGNVTAGLRFTAKGGILLQRYYCAANNAVVGQAKFCMRVGGVTIDTAMVEVFIEAINPVATEIVLLAEKNN